MRADSADPSKNETARNHSIHSRRVFQVVCTLLFQRGYVSTPPKTCWHIFKPVDLIVRNQNLAGTQSVLWQSSRTCDPEPAPSLGYSSLGAGSNTGCPGLKAGYLACLTQHGKQGSLLSSGSRDMRLSPSSDGWRKSHWKRFTLTVKPQVLVIPTIGVSSQNQFNSFPGGKHWSQLLLCLDTIFV